MSKYHFFSAHYQPLKILKWAQNWAALKAFWERAWAQDLAKMNVYMSISRKSSKTQFCLNCRTILMQKCQKKRYWTGFEFCKNFFKKRFFLVHDRSNQKFVYYIRMKYFGCFNLKRSVAGNSYLLTSAHVSSHQNTLPMSSHYSSLKT